MKVFSESKRLQLTYNVFFWTMLAMVADKMSDVQFVVLNSLVLGYYFGNRAYTDKQEITQGKGI
jgi:hypothetical protein